MAAEIKPVERQPSGVVQKPELLSKIEGFTADVNFAAFTPREDGVITVSDDRSELASNQRIYYRQGGHSSGKPGKVRELKSGQGKVRENELLQLFSCCDYCSDSNR